MKTNIDRQQKEYYQVVTTDRKKYFMEHKNIESAIEHITNLLNGTAPHNTYKYEIIHVIETRKEETINYPVMM